MTKDEWYAQLFERLGNSRFRSSLLAVKLIMPDFMPENDITHDWIKIILDEDTTPFLDDLIYTLLTF